MTQNASASRLLPRLILLAAAALLAAQDPDAIMVVLASDHYIPDTAAFQRSLAVAEQAAREGYIVTLGIMPNAPSTAYGYIRPASAPTVDMSVMVRSLYTTCIK